MFIYRALLKNREFTKVLYKQEYKRN